MLDWIRGNLGTILITLGLCAMVAAIVCKLRRDKRAGKSSCGGSCAHCGMGCACHGGCAGK